VICGNLAAVDSIPAKWIPTTLMSFNVTSRCTTTRPLRHAAFPYNYWLHRSAQIRNRKHFRRCNGSKCILNNNRFWAYIFVKSWSIRRSKTKMTTGSNDFYIFIPSDLNLWQLDLKFEFSPLVTYVFTKFELSAAFVFRESRRRDGWTDRQRDGQTEGVEHLMRPHRDGRIINH